jgi:hypothetical protein
LRWSQTKQSDGQIGPGRLQHTAYTVFRPQGKKYSSFITSAAAAYQHEKAAKPKNEEKLGKIGLLKPENRDEVLQIHIYHALCEESGEHEDNC